MSNDGLTIYGAHFSRAARCIWLALELGIPFEHEAIPYLDPALKQPPYLARNPMGKVPAINDRGFHLWESMAINYYIAQLKPNALWPQDLQGQALVMQWSFWGMAEVEKAGIALGLHTGLLPEANRSAEALTQANAVLARPLAVLEAALADHDYLLGEAFTLADLNVAGILWPIHAGKAVMDNCPRAQAWLARCLERPAAQSAFGLPTA